MHEIFLCMMNTSQDYLATAKQCGEHMLSMYCSLTAFVIYFHSGVYVVLVMLFVDLLSLPHLQMM